MGKFITAGMYIFTRSCFVTVCLKCYRNEIELNRITAEDHMTTINRFPPNDQNLWSFCPFWTRVSVKKLQPMCETSPSKTLSKRGSVTSIISPWPCFYSSVPVGANPQYPAWSFVSTARRPTLTDWCINETGSHENRFIHMILNITIKQISKYL